MDKKELEAQIKSHHRSTKNIFIFLVPWHDHLRQKYHWYQEWHMNPYAIYIHWLVLVVFVLFLIILLAILVSLLYTASDISNSYHNGADALQGFWNKIVY